MPKKPKLKLENEIIQIHLIKMYKLLNFFFHLKTDENLMCFKKIIIKFYLNMILNIKS